MILSDFFRIHAISKKISLTIPNYDPKQQKKQQNLISMNSQNFVSLWIIYKFLIVDHLLISK